MKRVDLHVHTTASDGTFSPAELVSLAKESGLSAVAITDHDTVSGIITDSVLEVVPGIELSTKYEGPVHILGYYIDPDNRELKDTLQGIVDDRDIRNEKIVNLMRSDGISITYAEMKDRFGDVVGRPHFAEILIENGVVDSPKEAFQQYLSKNQKYWFPRTTVPIDRCISLIVNAGGLAVLAHPFEYSYDKKTLPELIELCIGYGVKGIECRHSSHTPGQMAYLELLADEYGLIKTGGSDFHGSAKPNVRLGSGNGLVSVPYEWLERIKAKA